MITLTTPGLPRLKKGGYIPEIGEKSALIIAVIEEELMADKLSLKDWMSDAGLAKWFVQLNATDAPLPRANLKTALNFFDTNMPTLPASMALNFVLAMDLSRPVQAIQLSPHDNLIAFRAGNESPFKLFYTRSGASMHDSGINTFGRTAVRFRVRTPCPALESYTTGAKDVWSMAAEYQSLTIAPRDGSYGVMAYGGGIQLIVPNSTQFLEVDTGGMSG